MGSWKRVATGSLCRGRDMFLAGDRLSPAAAVGRTQVTKETGSQRSNEGSEGTRVRDESIADWRTRATVDCKQCCAIPGSWQDPDRRVRVRGLWTPGRSAH